MPAPHDDNIVIGVYPNRVRARGDRCKARGWRRGPLLLLSVKPPKKSIIRPKHGRRRRHLNPIIRNDLFVVPLASTQEQISESSLVASADPQAAAPTRAAAH